MFAPPHVRPMCRATGQATGEHPFKRELGFVNVCWPLAVLFHLPLAQTLSPLRPAVATVMAFSPLRAEAFLAGVVLVPEEEVGLEV